MDRARFIFKAALARSASVARCILKSMGVSLAFAETPIYWIEFE